MAKSLLAKISPESLDLLDDASLFDAGATHELFGKKFKKAMLKELKQRQHRVSTQGKISSGIANPLPANLSTDVSSLQPKIVVQNEGAEPQVFSRIKIDFHMLTHPPLRQPVV